MACLQRRLRRCGYRCVCYSYPSSARTLTENAAQLQEFLSRVPGETVHFVGHSLGGLLILQLFKDHPAQRPGRIVTLGAPHQGSFAARRLSGSRLGRRWLGAALPVLAHGLDLAPAGREIGGDCGPAQLRPRLADPRHSQTERRHRGGG
jgi:pimeloyl-ACP methyl ester carboxylesterase